jgi:hypothetical protein
LLIDWATLANWNAFGEPDVYRSRGTRGHLLESDQQSDMAAMAWHIAIRRTWVAGPMRLTRYDFAIGWMLSNDATHSS